MRKYVVWFALLAGLALLWYEYLRDFPFLYWLNSQIRSVLRFVGVFQ